VTGKVVVITSQRPSIPGTGPTSARMSAVEQGRPWATVTHAPGYGRLVAGLVTGDEPAVDPTPFRLDRFDHLDPAEIATTAADAIFELSVECFGR
jgi:hypothetical protein